MIHLWDTDTFPWWELRPDQFRSRLEGLRADDFVAVSVVTMYEALRGRVAVMAHARDDRFFSLAAAALERTFASIAVWRVLSYAPEASSRYAELRPGRGNRGSNDLRIAAIALAAGATLVTRNAAHFADIPGLVTENWID